MPYSKRDSEIQQIVYTKRDLDKSFLKYSFGYLVAGLILSLIIILIMRDDFAIKISVVLMIGLCLEVIINLIVYYLLGKTKDRSKNILTVNAEGIKLRDNNLIMWYLIEYVRVTIEPRGGLCVYVKQKNKRNEQSIFVAKRYIFEFFIKLQHLKDTLIFFSGDADKIKFKVPRW